MSTDRVSVFSSGQVICLVLLGAAVARLLYNRYGHGLATIPGPFLASFSDLWRLVNVWRRRPELTHIALHEKYGTVVRLGPKTLSISDPKAVNIIHALKSGFTKSEFYACQQNISKAGNRLFTLFTSLDEKFHAKLRRAVSNAYAMSTLVQFEPLVDSTTTEILNQLELRYANRPGDAGICDFGTWLQYYAFDVIGELTYSRRLGFVDEGKDIDGIIGALESLLGYAAVVGQIPFLDTLLWKNPVRLWLTKMGFTNSASPVAVFARRRISDRENSEKPVAEAAANTKNGVHCRDFLSRFLEAHHKDPEFIDNDRVLALTVANMVAGSDTTAITLRAIFYYLMRNPADLDKLQNELEVQRKLGNLTGDDGLVRWNEVKDLPFLSAVIKEALRCHPAVGLTLERIVPSCGMEISGHFVPGGAIVGVNAWVIHRDPAVFGDDAAQWHPDRWIEADEEKKRLMDNSIFTFGAGSRTCIGKNISLLEMYKLVPAILNKFDLEFVDPQREWQLHNAWFVKQSNFQIRLRSKTVR